MSARPGYDDLVEHRGRAVADEIVALAEQYGDAAHQHWAAALAWAIEYHERPHDPELVAQQEENARLYADMVERRGDTSRPIQSLVSALGGDAFDHPARLAQAEAIYDAEGWRLASGASMREQLDWAAAVAERAEHTGGEP